MTIAQLIAFNFALLAALLSPGPAMLYSIHASLSQGRIAGLQVGSGLALVASLWLLAAFIGLDLIFAIHPWLYLVAKFLGGGYLIYMAMQMWRNAPNHIGNQPIAIAARHPFFSGFLVNLLNPKSILFAAAVLVSIFPAQMPKSHIAFVVVNQFVVELVAYSIFAVLFSTKKISQTYFAAKQKIDRIAAVVLASLGLRLIMDRA